MGTEHVTVVADGMSYGGWEKVEWSAAIDEACRSFQVDTTERPGEFAFPPGTPVQILASGALVLDGYVNRYHSSGAAKQHSVSIAGRGKGQDLVDCSAVHQTGNAKDKTAVEFAREFKLSGVTLNEKVKLPKIPYQQLAQGETCFRCLERYLRPAGATLMGEADGSVSATNASVATRAGGALIEGVNILEWSVDFDDQGRMSEVTVKGQRRHGSGEENLRIKEQAIDSGVKRYRPRIIVNETDTDKARARERAAHEKERCAGNSIRASVTTQGWRDPAGALWTPNTIVFVNSPTLMHLVQDMLIERVEASQDDKRGTTARLSLVDPRAYRGTGQNGKGSDGAWNAGYDS
jgi:prophage tail gpP-like protein